MKLIARTQAVTKLSQIQLVQFLAATQATIVHVYIKSHKDRMTDCRIESLRIPRRSIHVFKSLSSPVHGHTVD